MNTGDPNGDADFVFFPSSFSSTTFVLNGITYTLKLTGFANVVGDGFLPSNSMEFHVREQGTASADLFAVVTASIPTSAPEPGTVAMVASALPVGLVCWLRRRKRTAA